MDPYLQKDEQEDLKKMLYSYLRDKANRRQGITSKAAYEGAEENFGNQMLLKDGGELLGAMSSAASMAGTLGGKRSEASIVPKMNAGLYGSTQGAYENFRTLRDSEERSNMNDLQVARYVSDLESRDDATGLATRDRDFREQQWKDQAPSRDLNRQILQKRLDAQASKKARYNGNLMTTDGRPVVMGEDGEPTELPSNITFRNKSDDPNADLKRRKLESDIARSDAQTNALKNRGANGKPMGSADKARYDNVRMATRAIDSVSQFFQKNAPGKGVFDRVKGRVNNMTTMGSTDYDLAADMWEEAIGRMQSGGAITTDEGVRFRRLFPTFEDSPEMIQKKINEMRHEMNSRMETLGQAPTNGVSAPSGSGGMGGGGKGKVARKQYSPSANKTKITYENGTVEVLDGRQ